MWSATKIKQIPTRPNDLCSFWKSLSAGLVLAFRKVCLQKKHHALHLQETLPLGERRFLAIVQWDEEKLLLGVTQRGISVLQSRQQTEPHRNIAAKDQVA